MGDEMKKSTSKINYRNCLALALAFFSIQACSSKYSYKEIAVPEPVKLSQHLQEMFSKTKLVCFGRYAVEVPQEAELVGGGVSVPSRLNIFEGGDGVSESLAAAAIAKIKRKERTAEITFSGDEPLAASRQIRYFENEFAKRDGSLHFQTYVDKAAFVFVIGDAIRDGETEEFVVGRQAARAKSLRLRTPDEVPDEHGFCVEHGFMSESQYGDQEMVNAGIFLPSLPDVTFFISSNKDAYGDYSKEAFEKEQRAKLSLLARIAAAKADQPFTYPSRTVLREGKRIVQHWHGEESLIKRKDGTHDFEWAFVGTPRDVANPSEFGAAMFTKVEHNTVGAAKAASLSDDEAVALFDKLLSGLKFRVKVPGAPEGSYFLPASKPAAIASK
jgi:hypothetical protein